MNNKEIRFKKVLSENKERIERICSYYNPDKESQKDIYQEIVINIWKSLDNFRGESSISTWVYRIAVNTSLTFTGKAFKQMKLMVNADTLNLSSVVDENLLQEKIKQENLFELLQNELNQLSVIDKAMISLMLEGLTMKEIANIIGITETNVRVKIHRIKEHLKLNLGGYYDK